MVARWQMEEAFGENVTRMDYELTKTVGALPADRSILSHVGLPNRLGSLFTTDVTDNPRLFSVKDFGTSGEHKRALTLGGPVDDIRMRFVLDLQEGYVVLVSLHGDTPQAEIVNTQLDDFVEFLCRFAKREKDLRQAPPEEAREYTEGFIEVLQEIDPLAFSQPDSWWSMATEQLRR